MILESFFLTEELFVFTAAFGVRCHFAKLDLLSAYDFFTVLCSVLELAVERLIFCLCESALRGGFIPAELGMGHFSLR